MSRITINDIRQAGHCVRGAKAWFGEHGLDFNAMLAGGIDESEFLADGDALAKQVVDRKREQEGG